MTKPRIRVITAGVFALAATSAIAGPPKGSPQDSCGYPNGSVPALSSVAFSESDVLTGFQLTDSSVIAWYTDEHALTLGVRQVIVKTAAGKTPTTYALTNYTINSPSAPFPQVGTTLLAGLQAGTDSVTYNATYKYLDNGRPIWPALFLTDLTTKMGGDWQQHGTPIAPDAVYGVWKGAVKTVDQTRSPAVITITPDADPAKNFWNGIPDVPPGGFGSNEGYTAELVWNLSSLSLHAGDTYRLQFMIHDGDQNKSGGDAGEACVGPVIAPPPPPSGPPVLQ